MGEVEIKIGREGEEILDLKRRLRDNAGEFGKRLPTPFNIE
jgi:hypothetical protein